jgi:hypothetical protein
MKYIYVSLEKPDVRIAVYCHREWKDFIEEGEKIMQYEGGSYGIKRQ